MHATAEDLTVLLHDESGTDVRSIDFDTMAANINRHSGRSRRRIVVRPQAAKWVRWPGRGRSNCAATLAHGR